MCLNPILIDNPDYNSHVRDPTYHIIHDTKNQKIQVPCGRCEVCIHLRQMYMVQRVQMEALNHDLYYGTLTYNQESLPIAEYDNIRFAYPDISDWQKMIKMIRKDYPELKFKYLLVSEYGGKRHRPHYHFILSLPKLDDRKRYLKFSKAEELWHIFLKYWRRNYGSTRVPDWKPLCTYRRIGDNYNFDLHWLDPSTSDDGTDGVAFYVTKYVLKFDKWVDKFRSKLFFETGDKFQDAWDKFRPRFLYSKGFGSPEDPDVIRHINKGIQVALSDRQALYPYYVSQNDGSTYPLSPYYRNRFLTIPQQVEFCLRRPQDEFETNLDRIALLQKSKESDFHLSEVRRFLSNRCNSFEYDDIDNINLTFNHFDYGENFTAHLQDEDFTACRADFDTACSDFDVSDDVIF